MSDVTRLPLSVVLSDAEHTIDDCSKVVEDGEVDTDAAFLQHESDFNSVRVKIT